MTIVKFPQGGKDNLGVPLEQVCIQEAQDHVNKLVRVYPEQVNRLARAIRIAVVGSCWVWEEDIAFLRGRLTILTKFINERMKGRSAHE